MNIWMSTMWSFCFRFVIILTFSSAADKLQQPIKLMNLLKAEKVSVTCSKILTSKGSQLILSGNLIGYRLYLPQIFQKK